MMRKGELITFWQRQHLEYTRQGKESNISILILKVSTKGTWLKGGIWSATTHTAYVGWLLRISDNIRAV